MSTLAQFETRISAALVDSSNSVFPLTVVDEALRTALSEYTTALPLATETYITLPGTGREIALNNLAGLIAVLDVWWPFDPLTEVWPPNMVAGFRVWWDDAQPLLLLASKSANQPKINDNLRIWYTRPHMIQNLDSAAITSVFPNHESAIVGGAAAYCAISETRHQTGTIRIDPTEVPALQNWGNIKLQQWHDFLASLAAASPSFGAPFADGWGIDKWDANRGSSQSRPWTYPY